MPSVSILYRKHSAVPCCRYYSLVVEGFRYYVEGTCALRCVAPIFAVYSYRNIHTRFTGGYSIWEVYECKVVCIKAEIFQTYKKFQTGGFRCGFVKMKPTRTYIYTISDCGRFISFRLLSIGYKTSLGNSIELYMDMWEITAGWCNMRMKWNSTQTMFNIFCQYLEIFGFLFRFWRWESW